MASCKTKSKYERATHEQLVTYVTFCNGHPEIGAKSPRQVQDLWKQLAEELNACRGPTRTSSKWKETLGVWKSQLRTRARRLKMNQRHTEGEPMYKPMSDFEKKALATFESAAVRSFGLKLPNEPSPCASTSVSLGNQNDTNSDTSTSREERNKRVNTRLANNATTEPKSFVSHIEEEQMQHDEENIYSKNRRVYQNGQSINKNHCSATELLFLSFAKTLETLSPLRQTIVKQKISNIIFNEELLAQQSVDSKRSRPVIQDEASVVPSRENSPLSIIKIEEFDNFHEVVTNKQ